MGRNDEKALAADRPDVTAQLSVLNEIFGHGRCPICAEPKCTIEEFRIKTRSSDYINGFSAAWTMAVCKPCWLVFNVLKSAGQPCSAERVRNIRLKDKK